MVLKDTWDLRGSGELFAKPGHCGQKSLGNGKHCGAIRRPSKAGKVRGDRKLLGRLAGEGREEWEGGKRELCLLECCSPSTVTCDLVV